MGIITGYICLVLLLVLMAKFVIKRIGSAKLNKVFQKMHMTVAIVFVTVTVIHFVLVLPVLKARAALVTETGIFLMILAIVLTVVSIYMKKGKKFLKIHHVISVLLIVGMVGHIAFYFSDFSQYKSAIDKISIEDVDISEVKDGTYEGEYDAGYIYAKVQVKIEEGRICDVELLEHRNERGARAGKITKDMISQQKVNVDAVSGATNSSKVIKKAVENALESK